MHVILRPNKVQVPVSMEKQSLVLTSLPTCVLISLGNVKYLCPGDLKREHLS